MTDQSVVECDSGDTLLVINDGIVWLDTETPAYLHADATQITWTSEGVPRR